MVATPVILRGTEATVDQLSDAVMSARADVAYALAMLRQGGKPGLDCAREALERIQAALEGVSL